MQDTLEDFDDLPAADDYIGQQLWLAEDDRMSIEEAIQKNDFDGLEGFANSKISFINESYSREGKSAEELKYQLRCLWYVYYQVGKNISHTSPEQDTWVLQIVRLHGQGNLTRRAQSSHNSDELEIATTSAGIIWEDLPFFTADMTDFWVKDCATMRADQRVDFSCFLAKLASTGVDDNLCGIALLVFKDTFETVRPLGSFNDQSDEDPQRYLRDLTIAALFPIAQTWLLVAHNKIIQLSDKLLNSFDTARQDETTFTKSELGRRLSAAFNPWRWMYWLKRMEDIKEEAEQAGEGTLAKSALNTMVQLLSKVEDKDTRVQRELETVGNLVKIQHRFSRNAC
ncbi:hypothetical protein CFAM422_000881 [Trichoderma lentiforme]|uniref:Uncharacterized protein n=1 Tax=Trichoderma lentiforme TaxID=1567552 RepID=A0A9P4XRK3_9HYPO|nr:hypothetical protein CFAM422_000881 [Trichoderma lentiforme]